MIQAEFILELLVDLLASPAGLEYSYDFQQRCGSRMIGQVVAYLARGAAFTDEPDFSARRVFPVGASKTICRAYPQADEMRL